MTATECQRCSTDQWDYGSGCIDGYWYGHCGSVDCTGMCEFEGACDCECHD